MIGEPDDDEPDSRRGRTLTDHPHIVDHLGAWKLTEPVCRPIAHAVQSSDTWLVEAVEGRYVAKLVADRREFVEPGLRVASAVAAAGIPTGAPLPTRSGQLCMATFLEGARPATLALLEFVNGERLTPDAPDADRIAGDLLGRVHSILARDSRRDWVPAELLSWSAEFASHIGKRQAGDLITRAIQLVAAGELTMSVIYGDPAPEIILTGAGAALIDWGTPSWGPQLHDVAVWLRWLRSGAAPADRQGEAFVDAYLERGVIREAELAHLPLVQQYVDAFFS